MRFWDSSALVPTIVDERTSERMRALLSADAFLAVWWATPIECASAIARRERGERDSVGKAASAFAILDELSTTWIEIPPTERLRDDARRIVRTHDLRAADAFQLAAARAASEQRSDYLPFVTLDERLALAAGREGFPILGLG